MRSRKDTDSPWRTADERMLNSMTIEARLQGINVWGNETRRYLFSQSIEDYDPIDDYLKHLRGRWDGKDHVAQLAATVSTNNNLWPLWLRRWLLAMVAQWTGKNQNYGNAVAPLLVAPQGYHKSTFCRQLLPPALRWGYADGLQVSQKQQMLQAMSQLLLINLDEFNQISRQAQEGFVKNIMQMAVVKARRPYGSRLEDLPRRASFIATSNMTDVLTDPSGSRRFLVVEVNSPINTDTPIDHDQLYAQLVDALDRGERYWFNDEESSAIIAHNRQYQRLTPAEQCFYEYFAPAPDEKQGQWLTTSNIFTELRRRTGAIIPPNGLLAFGRMLSQSSNLRRRRTHQGTEYLVRHL
jgi:predicted P-loop ATPase